MSRNTVVHREGPRQTCARPLSQTACAVGLKTQTQTAALVTNGLGFRALELSCHQVGDPCKLGEELWADGGRPEKVRPKMHRAQNREPSCTLGSHFWGEKPPALVPVHSSESIPGTGTPGCGSSTPAPILRGNQVQESGNIWEAG